MKRDLQEVLDAIAVNVSNKKYWHYQKKPMPLSTGQKMMLNCGHS
jgi:hypothetical protein